jgi:basic amino acid/polyamine antiporter, APA family
MGASHEPLTLPAAPRTPDPEHCEGRPAASLGLWDAVSIVVGIVVGVGIFKAPQEVFAQATGPGTALAAWVLGGLLSLAGALCFAELASTFPRSGGEYVYLTRAFGRGAGFLFAWGQLAVIRTGGAIGGVAYVFAEYAAPALGLPSSANVPLAALVIALLTGINVLGVNPGRLTQNLLTLFKVLAVSGIILAGFLGPSPTPAAVAATPTGSFALVMVFVLYAYGGWHEAAYVTAEVRDRRRNVPLALIAGAAIVTALYVLVNAAWLLGFGFEGARQGTATALLAGTLGTAAGRTMSVLVMLSALGSLNGTIFTGSRIYQEMGADHALFASLAVRSPRFGTPVRSLLLQAAVSVALVLFAGWLLPAWTSGEKPSDPFGVLVTGSAPVFYLCFLMTGVSLFVFRARAPESRSPFAVPFYPWIPLVFCGSCAYMLVGSVLDFDGKTLAFRQESLVGLAVLAAGLPLWLISRRREMRHPAVSDRA